MAKLTQAARIGNTIFNVGVDEGAVIECAQRNYKNINKVSELKSLPKELICLSCLATQSTQGVLNRGNMCFSCESTLDPYNLSDIEV
tara:strand:- start:780 stop:1040 length:261 start_codon:yes stop_codon:yes gene_type:complete